MVLKNMTARLTILDQQERWKLLGAKRIFERSIEKHNLRYTKCLGDGDSKSFTSVKSTYPGIEVQKLECVGHIQKRVGTRLRNLKKNVKNLGGKGKLTNKTIDLLQNYYGIAVRSNVGNLKGMQNNICAALFHVASSKTNNYHSAYCPPGESSWYKYQRDKSAGTSTYKPGHGLPLEIIKHVKPIFAELSKETLLSKCLHGKTQNQNESYNALIWERLPKLSMSRLPSSSLGHTMQWHILTLGRKVQCLFLKNLI